MDQCSAPVSRNTWESPDCMLLKRTTHAYEPIRKCLDRRQQYVLFVEPQVFRCVQLVPRHFYHVVNTQLLNLAQTWAKTKASSSSLVIVTPQPYVVDVSKYMRITFYLCFSFILIRTCAMFLSHWRLFLQSFPLDTFPFHATVLKPHFDLPFGQVQAHSDFVSSQSGQVIISLKLVFQFLYLMFGESCSFLSLLTGGFSGFRSCKINKNTI